MNQNMFPATERLLCWVSLGCVIALGGLCHCRGCGSQAPAPGVKDGGQRLGASPGEGDAGQGGPGGGVNLLHRLPAQVVVSSVAHPRRQGPSKLIDGDLSTAWQGAVGDMVGAWVAFSLPWDVQVRRVKLGLPQAEGKRRRATAAVRRLQLSREGAVVAELDVAPGREPFVEWSVEERGGLFTVEVLEVARGAKMRQIGFSELEVWGHPNGATASVDYIEPDRLAREQEAPEQAWPLARVMTLAGAGGGPLVEATALSGRSTRTWPLPTKRGQWSAFPREDRDYVRVLQGSWSRLVRPERLVALSGRNGDRVFLALYHVLVAQEETAGTGPRSARRRCRGRTELLCTDAYLARVSLPARGVPVLDATTKVASNICGVTSKVALRDIDGDRKDELHLQLEWQTRRRCGAPGSYISEMIFDESTLRRQYQAVLTERPADACARSWQAEREVRDINADGFPDFFVNRQISEPTCRGRGRPRVQRLFADESFLYDPELDEWRRAAEETQPTPDG